MISIVRNETVKTDMIIHLGDTVSDAAALESAFPHIAFLSVAGNNDRFTKIPLKRTFSAEGVKFLLAHGHFYDAHLSLLGLYYAAKQDNAQIILFGHTHIPKCENKDGILLFNPGSISRPRGNFPCSYGVLEIENGKTEAQIKYLED
jgi:putative phosphoesterase